MRISRILKLAKDFERLANKHNQYETSEREILEETSNWREYFDNTKYIGWDDDLSQSVLLEYDAFWGIEINMLLKL